MNYLTCSARHRKGHVQKLTTIETEPQSVGCFSIWVQDLKQAREKLLATLAEIRLLSTCFHTYETEVDQKIYNEMAILKVMRAKY